jgi:hypothetical protein
VTFAQLPKLLNATEREIIEWICTGELTPLDGVATVQIGGKSVNVPRYRFDACKGVTDDMLYIEFDEAAVNQFTPKGRWICLDDIALRWAKYDAFQGDIMRILKSNFDYLLTGKNTPESFEGFKTRVNDAGLMFPLHEIEDIEARFPSKMKLARDGVGSQTVTGPASVKDERIVTGSKPSTTNASQVKGKKFEYPETIKWKAEAWKIGIERMEKRRKEGKDPGVVEIAKYVEGELSNRGITGRRGKFLDSETIKRDALTGITGRPPNGKRTKS